MNKTILQTLLALLFGALVAGCGSHDQRVRHLRLAHNMDTNHPVHQGILHMARVLAELSGHTMQIDVYPNGQLGSERELIELLQIGSVDMTKVSASPLEGFSHGMQVFSIPYVFRDTAHYYHVMDTEVGRELLLSLQQVRLRGLAYYDAGSRSFYMTDKAVLTPADLVGEKIRVQQSATSVRMIEIMGGAATPIAWGELYTALQQGVVDGAENNPPSFYLSRHYEAARYYSLDEHTSVPDVLLIGLRSWDSLDGQQKRWLQQAADDSVQVQRELWQQATRDALEALRAAGVEVIEPDKRAFRAAVKPMHASYRGAPMGELLERIEAVQ
jgi:tripartite ATP-independent transporter DctP family solute receptor